MRKILTIVGTRPELIKLSCVIPMLDKYTDHILVHTGQNYDYELSEIFFSGLGIRKPDHFLEVAQDSPSATIARIIERADEVIAEVEPDGMLIYGDTNSCLAVIAAKRRRVPIFHMEAGNRCFDLRVPEETNRKIIDHLSDINMTLTEHARRYLIAEGIRPETIIKVGSSMQEVVSANACAIDESVILEKLGIEPRGFLLVSAHREENIESDVNFSRFVDTLDALAERFEIPIIISTHPRTRKRLDKNKERVFSPLIRFLKPLGFVDYMALQQSSYCVVSDSGTITEESSILGFPAITIRDSHERPEGMDEGALIMSGMQAAKVINAIEVVVDQLRIEKFTATTAPDYVVSSVSHKIVRIILSHIDYVNRTVWHEQ